MRTSLWYLKIVLSQLPYVLQQLKNPSNICKMKPKLLIMYTRTPGTWPIPASPASSLPLLTWNLTLHKYSIEWFVAPAVLYHISIPLFILFPLPEIFSLFLFPFLCLFESHSRLSQLPLPWGRSPLLIHTLIQRSFSLISSLIQEVYLRHRGRTCEFIRQLALDYARGHVNQAKSLPVLFHEGIYQFLFLFPSFSVDRG